ncbi:hypothetical protein MUY27_14375 [Mucilaginibacter sp. RS28]|uniref:DUF4397 domain-containing protein n=1 Tax=Mucilaginibacter straminoryzae TaxID=2932774 RepID=A0A9X2BAK9_9SPHI|nr:hypothetical protein [Mucilaginibacter straminoryzae]MCJ8210900.1 hypothetical protein [Mucilaginibacter straminoryzae]
MRDFYRLRFLWIIALAAVAFSGCTKGDDEPAADTNNKLIIAFSSATVPITGVDSVICTFTSSTDTIRKKGLREGTFYSFLLSSLPSGTYSALTKIYTTADSAGTRKMFRNTTSISTSKNSNIIAASDKPYDTWASALYFYSALYNITFAVGYYPTDSYFEMRLPATLPFKNIYISRNLYRTVNKIKYQTGYGYINIKTSDYKGSTSNTNAFYGFSTGAANLKYDAADVTFELYNDVNNDYAILFQKEIAIAN